MPQKVRRCLSALLLTGGLFLALPVHAQDSGFYDYLFQDLTWPQYSLDVSFVSAEAVLAASGNNGYWDFVISDISWPDREIDPEVSFSFE